MTKREALKGKPFAGNPHVRFDEGEVAPAATPRRGSLLYKGLPLYAVMICCLNVLGETYMADVDAIETDKTQAFDTGVAVDGALKVEMDLQWMAIDNDDNMLFGASDGTKRCFLAIYGGHYYIGYGNETIHIQNKTVCPVVGDRHTVTCVFESGHLSFATNGVELCSESKSVATVNNTLGLLAYKMASQVKYRSSVRLYSAKIWKKSAGEWCLVRDYRPVLAKQSDGMTCVGALKDDTQGVLASTNIAFSAEAVSTNVAARAVMLPIVGEPDELLNWVETDGRQFIDTDVMGGAAVSFSADFAWKDLGTGSNEEYTFLGATSGYGRFYAIHAISKSSGGQLWVGYGDKTGYPADSGNGNLVMPLLARKTLSGTFAAGSQTLSCEGTAYSLSSPQSSVVNSKFAPLYLFALDVDSNADGSRVKCFSSVRFHSLSISVGGTEVRHFLPCLKDGVAALYDSVNHCIYRSPVPFSACGKLSDVPKSYVEYVETSGAQFVDTGIIGKSGTKIEVDFSWIGNASSERTLIGSHDAFSDPAVRFVPFGGTFYSTRAESYYCYESSYRYPSFWSNDLGEYHKSVHLKINERHRLVADFRAGSQSLEIDGSCYYYNTDTSSLVSLSGSGRRTIDAYDHTMAANVDTGISMYLFARHKVDATADKATQNASVRFYRAKIWQLDAGGIYRLVRDYRPVKLQAGEVVLWDGINETYQSVCWSGVGPDTKPYNMGFVISFK